MVLLDNDELPMVSGGPLGDSEYVFHQYHFHWGPTDQLGSEFMMNGKRYPLEMHIVFWNQDYHNFEDALDYFDGLCVLSFLFEVTTNDNPAFDYLVTDALHHVIFADTTKQLSYHPRLADIIAKDTEHYYTMHGSLTTPPCSEVVTWIDFQQTIPMSTKQLGEFRFFENSVGQPIPFNFRPIQAKNDRIVMYNVRNGSSKSCLWKKWILSILIIFNFLKIKILDKYFFIFFLGKKSTCIPVFLQQG
jgi:carbonic anhydrase